MRLARSLIAIAFLSVSAAMGDEPVPIDKLPQRVVESLKQKFPKAMLTEATKSEDAEYTVTLKEGGKELDVTLTAEGAITFIEKEIAGRDLPKAVAAAVQKKAPKATHEGAWVGIAVKDGKETVEYYWIELQSAAKRRIELEIAPDGALLQVVREITAKDLPKAVSDAVLKKYPKAEFKSLEVVMAIENGKEIPEFYRVELVTSDKKLIELEVQPDGSLEAK